MTQMICEKAKDCPLGDPYCAHKEYHKENKNCGNIVCYGTVCIPDPPAPQKFEAKAEGAKEQLDLWPALTGRQSHRRAKMATRITRLLESMS